MVDVIGVSVPLAQLDEVAQDLDEVVPRQHRGGRGCLETQTLVDLVATDAAQVVAPGVEENALQRGTRRIDVRRLSGTQERVDLEERRLLGLGWILGQRTLDDGALRPYRAFARCATVRFGLCGIDDDLVAAHARQRLDVRFLEFAGGFENHFARVGVHHVVRQHRAAQRLERVGKVADRSVLLPEEEAVDVLVGAEAQGAQQCRGRELLLVDVDVADVVDVDRELHPGAAEGNDPGAVQLGPVGMDALLEDDAGRTMQLAHHDALGAVDDEGAQVGEQRQIPQVDLFLDDVARAALPVVQILPDNEAKRRLQGRGVGHVPLDALLLRIAGGAQLGRDVFEAEVLVHIGDRKNLLKNAVEREIPGILCDGVAVNQIAEGLELYIQEIRHRHDRIQLVETDDGSSGVATIQVDSPYGPHPVRRAVAASRTGNTLTTSGSPPGGTAGTRAEGRAGGAAPGAACRDRTPSARELKRTAPT